MPAHAADQKPSRLAMAPGAAGAQHNPVKDRGFVWQKQPALKKLPEQFHAPNPPGQHPDLHSPPYSQPAMKSLLRLLIPLHLVVAGAAAALAAEP
ncbi:MAG: hypothetical protein RLZZ253_1332, partial [Verrucomicrobiota bacterium]